MNYRNKKLTQLARDLPCAGCGRNDGTTVWAHSNQIRHGKGMGIKAPDYFGAILCAKCHSWLDEGPAPKEEKVEFFSQAFENTVATLWLSESIKVAK